MAATLEKSPWVVELESPVILKKRRGCVVSGGTGVTSHSKEKTCLCGEIVPAAVDDPARLKPVRVAGAFTTDDHPIHHLVILVDAKQNVIKTRPVVKNLSVSGVISARHWMVKLFTTFLNYYRDSGATHVRRIDLNADNYTEFPWRPVSTPCCRCQVDQSNLQQTLKPLLHNLCLVCCCVTPETPILLLKFISSYK